MNFFQKQLRKFSIYELVIIAVMASLGLAIKPVVVPITHLISGPLMIPSGAFAGGLYMMWLVVSFGITGKYGTGTLVALVQALVVTFTGMIGSHGIMSLVSYTLPGIVMDIGLFIIGHKVCCAPCAFVAGLLANVTGTAVVNFIFFSLPSMFLIFTLCVAAFSGGLGGILAWQIIKLLKKYRVISQLKKQNNLEASPITSCKGENLHNEADKT